MSAPIQPEPTTSELAAQTPGLLREGLDLLERLARSPRGELEQCKQQAAGFVDRYRTYQQTLLARRKSRLAPDRAADGWILDIFSATENAIAREQLVIDFVDRYRRERQLADRDTHRGPWLFVFEADESQREVVGVRPLFSAGVHTQAFARACAAHLDAAGEDPFLDCVMFQGQDIDGWHALWFGGSPLFDQLLDVRGRLGGDADYWVNAVALPGDGRHAGRGVFLLHSNTGTAADPVPPSAMRQDQRLLMVLALAWRQLEHQIKGLARISEEDRRGLISLLGPGLLHHEIGAAMNTLYAQAAALFSQLRDLALANPQYDVLDIAARRAHAIAIETHRVFGVTDAFNMLDRRAVVEDVSLGKLVSQLATLLQRRLIECRTELRFDAAALEAQVVHTDAVLLLQALLNLVNNALNALFESDTGGARWVEIALLGSDDKRLSIAVGNNGPDIAARDLPYLFRRGYTTRSQGHGQGLYLARLIARYLGGDLALMESVSLQPGWTLGFRLSLGRSHAALDGAARAVT